MSIGLVALILMSILFALLAIGLEIGASIGLVAVVGLLFFSSQPLFNIPGQAWDLTNSFILTAIPMFIFMGEVFSQTGISRKLFWAVDRWLGFLPGGVAITVIGACSVFAAITGSSVAGAATMGSVAIPSMRERKYNMRLTFGVIASGGTLGILIPPSIIMIVYGAFQGLSVGRLFASGIVPGVILAATFMLFVVITVTLKPELAPKRQTYTWKERFEALGQLLPSLIVIGVVLGGVFTGIMTPTEAAAMGALAVVVIALVSGTFTMAVLRSSIECTVRTTAIIMLVAIMAKASAFLMQFLGLGEMFTEMILGAGLGKYGTIAVIYGIYLVLGCFFEGISMMVLTLPFVMPIIRGLGMSPYWFNVPLVIMIEASLLTPPVGLNLYVMHGLAPDYDLMEIARGAVPFLIPMLLVVALVTGYPEIVLWLPDLIYGGR